MRIFMNETVDCHDRGLFYESSGVVRDVIQNHILQMFALATMDSSSKDVRKAKVQILQKTKVVGSILAQYEGYREHNDVSESSVVPTFASIQVEVEGWEGVEMFLESGKALTKRDAAIQVLFNDGGELFLNIHDGSSVYTSAGD